MLPILQSGLMFTLLCARLSGTLFTAQPMLALVCAEAPLNLKQGKPGEKYLRQTAYPMTSRRGAFPKVRRRGGA
jgi:hypothetical protein